MKLLNKQNGAVSLFVVIFAALLFTVITVSFVRIMVQNQQEATATDLSQSAFDSAQAGVEDAKRALIRFQNYCDKGGDCSISSTEYKNLNSPSCNIAVNALNGVDASSGEVEVKTNSNDTELDQSYTCVKIETKTDDYDGILSQDTSKFIPLIGAGSFDRVQIEWFNKSDLIGSNALAQIPPFSIPPPLLSQNSWTSPVLQNRPSVLRSQLIQYNRTGFLLTDFEGTGAVASNNTLFLYPSTILGTGTFDSNLRKTANVNVPNPVICNTLNQTQNYACSTVLSLPHTVIDKDHIQYLNLTSFYKTSHYRITLWNGSNPGSTPVKFDNVQPSIDSTGRANDLFRRVKTRVELTNVNFPYPAAEIDVTGNICKDFSITDVIADYPTINTISPDGSINGCKP